MRRCLSILLLTATCFAATDEALSTGPPSSLDLDEGDGPVDRRLKQADSGNEERGIDVSLFVEKGAGSMVALVMEAMHHVYDARDRVYRYIATRSLPRQHRNILARYVTALKSNKRDSVDKMMSSFNVLSIASTIDALKGVKDQHIQDIASSMQSNMIRMWSNKGLSPDTLYKDLNLGKNIWNRIKKSESDFRLSNQPDFKLWVAFVNDVWKQNLGNEFEKLDDELKAMMILITGSKHERTKVKGAQGSYINKWTSLKIDPVKEEVLVNLKKLKRSNKKR